MNIRKGREPGNEARVFAYSTGMWIEPITLQQRRNCTYGIRISYNIGFPCTSARSYSYPEMSESAIRQALYVGVEKLGYATVCPQQELAVLKFAAGQDVFVSLPTGSGKSLCYCVLPAVFDSLRGVKGLSIIVVVSPLIALMKDQVRAMMDRGTMAVYVGDCEDEQTVATVCSGQHQIVYMSPEALLRDERWRDMLLSDVYSERLVALVVDEAHCVKKWYEATVHPRCSYRVVHVACCC